MPDTTGLEKPPSRRRPGRPVHSSGARVDGRLRLLEAAVEQFGHLGYEAVSLRALADKAGLDAALVVHHFGSKQQLWRAAVDAVAARYQPQLAVLEELLQAPGPLQQRVHDVIDFFIQHVSGHQGLFRFIQRELGYPGPRLQYLTRTLVEPCYALCEPLWQQAIAMKLLRSPHPAVFHFLLFGALSTTLGAAPMIAQLAGQEVDQTSIMRSLRVILQGHFPDGCADCL